MKCLVVVAKYEEDTSWLDRLPPEWETRVYDKGPSGTCENVGREAETYARCIYEEYDQLHAWDRIVFLQGHPFDHDCSIEQIVRGVEDPGLVAFGQCLACDGHGAPHHLGGIKVAEAHAHLGLDPAVAERNQWIFCAGAQYSVPSSVLLKRPREFWKQVHDALYRGEICPWSMERLWAYVFVPRGSE
jgi:hypothetical protein